MYSLSSIIFYKFKKLYFQVPSENRLSTIFENMKPCLAILFPSNFLKKERNSAKKEEENSEKKRNETLKKREGNSVKKRKETLKTKKTLKF